MSLHLLLLKSSMIGLSMGHLPRPLGYPVSREYQADQAGYHSLLPIRPAHKKKGQTSVTRFGEFSPLWQSFESLWPFVKGLFSAWQNFVPTLAKFYCYSLQILILKNGPNLASFCLCLSFSQHNDNYSTKFDYKSTPNFHSCKWPNIEQIIKPSGHTWANCQRLS